MRFDLPVPSDVGPDLAKKIAEAMRAAFDAGRVPVLLKIVEKYPWVLGVEFEDQSNPIGFLMVEGGFNQSDVATSSEWLALSIVVAATKMPAIYRLENASGLAMGEVLIRRFGALSANILASGYCPANASSNLLTVTLKRKDLASAELLMNNNYPLGADDNNPIYTMVKHGCFASDLRGASRVAQMAIDQGCDINEVIGVQKDTILGMAIGKKEGPAVIWALQAGASPDLLSVGLENCMRASGLEAFLPEASAIVMRTALASAMQNDDSGQCAARRMTVQRI